MSDNNSKNRDSILARQYGELLEKKRSQSSISDPIFDQLLEYKNDKKQENSDRINSSNKNEIWDNIEQKIDDEPPQNAQPVRVTFLSTGFRKIAAVAASLLVVCLAGLYYYLAQPVLIEKTGAKIAEITLADGSKVTLRPHSTLYKKGVWSLSDYKYRLDGEGYFQVVDQSNDAFSVKAGNGGVRVMGTVFNVSAWGNTTRVYLQEGKVQVEDITTNETVILEPEQSALVNTGANIDKQTTADESEYTDWMQQQLVFKNRTVQYVFSELEQQFNITILANQNVMETRLSGELSVENLNDALKDLEIVLDGSFVEVNEGSTSNTYRFEAND